MVCWPCLLFLSALTGVSYGITFSHQCGVNGASFSFTLLFDLEGDTRFEYMTFKDNSGTELITDCSTTNGQITGSGNSTDPYAITVIVDPTVDINLGSPNCGHVANGVILDWTAFVLQTLPPPLPGANGLELEQTFQCDFTNVTLPIAGQFVQPNHLNLTQEATVLCSKNGTVMTLAFQLTVNNDTVVILFSRDISNSTINTAGTFDSMGNGIAGTGSAADPYKFSISADCASTPAALTPEAVTRFAFSQGADVIGIRIMAKSIWAPGFWDTFDFPDDVIYTAFCNCSEVQENILRTGDITVVGTNHEIPNVIVESAALEVWNAQSMVPTISVSLGEGIFLRVNVDPATQSTGQYVYSCFVCDTANCTGTIKRQFIDANGCSTLSPYFIPFSVMGGLLRTNTFPSFKLNDQAWLYFQCSVNYCYDPADLRCPNYCTFTAGRRKRRQVVESPAEESTVTAYLTITSTSATVARNINGTTVNDPTTCKTEPVHETQTVWLLAVAVTIVGLLLIDLVVHVGVLFRFSSIFRRSGKKI